MFNLIRFDHYLEATHFIDTIAMMLRPTVATFILAGSFLQILLIILEVVDGWWCDRAVPDNTDPRVLILLQQRIRIKYLGYE